MCGRRLVLFVVDVKLDGVRQAGAAETSVLAQLAAKCPEVDAWLRQLLTVRPALRRDVAQAMAINVAAIEKAAIAEFQQTFGPPDARAGSAN
jgi:hypothetical protein